MTLSRRKGIQDFADWLKAAEVLAGPVDQRLREGVREAGVGVSFL